MSAEGDFDLDPGHPPRVDEDELEPRQEPGQQPPGPGPALELEPGLLPEGWTEEGAGAIFETVGVILNAVTRARGGGPEDVFLVLDEERRLFGGAFARWGNRHDVVRRMASHGDAAIMGVTVTSYAVREAGRAAAYRELFAEENADLEAERPAHAGAVEPEKKEPRSGRRWRRVDREPEDES